MQVAVECLVEAPPEVAFAAAVDISNWPDSFPAFKASRLLTPGPVAVGTSFRETRIMFGRQATEEMTFAEIAPPDRFVLTAFNHGTAYRAEHLFAARGPGTNDARLRGTAGDAPLPPVCTIRVAVPGHAQASARA